MFYCLLYVHILMMVLFTELWLIPRNIVFFRLLVDSAGCFALHRELRLAGWLLQVSHPPHVASHHIYMYKLSVELKARMCIIRCFDVLRYDMTACIWICYLELYEIFHDEVCKICLPCYDELPHANKKKRRVLQLVVSELGCYSSSIWVRVLHKPWPISLFTT